MTEPTDRPLIPGDTVVTKIGGPPMLVTRIHQNSPDARLISVTWFDRIRSHVFDEAALRLWQETPPIQPPQTPKTETKTKDLNHISVAGNDLITLSEAAIACDQIGWDDTAKALRAIIYQATLTPDWSPLNSEASRASIGRSMRTFYERYGRACDAPSPPSRPATQGDPGITTPFNSAEPIVDQAEMDREPAEMTPYCPRAARAAIDDPLPQDPRPKRGLLDDGEPQRLSGTPSRLGRLLDAAKAAHRQAKEIP